jgi:hypothetical protein
MGVTMAAAKAQVQDAHPIKLINITASSSVLYFFDGARIHQSALKLDATGHASSPSWGEWNAALQATLPHYTPDLHKVSMLMGGLRRISGGGCTSTPGTLVLRSTQPSSNRSF